MASTSDAKADHALFTAVEDLAHSSVRTRGPFSLTRHSRLSGPDLSAFEAAAFRNSPDTPPLDPWFAEDKWKHYSFSFILTVQGQYLLQSIAGDEEAPVHLSVPLSVMGLGLAKEFSDRRRSGLFSIPDLVWDGLGVLTAVAVLNTIHH